jgi:DNA modification methylase
MSFVAPDAHRTTLASPGHASGVERVIRLSADDLVNERVEGATDDVHFPQALVRTVLEEFTSSGDVVLDPFAGYGTTLLVGQQMGRDAVGVELLPDRADMIRQRLDDRGWVITGDARRLADFDIGPVDLCLTSPPYMNSVDHRQNPLTGYQTLDANYWLYLEELAEVFRAVGQVLRPGGHLVINAANIITGTVITRLAWDIACAVSSYLRFAGETYLWWDRTPPGLVGDYCLLFERS